jgi:antitoxin CptB
MDTNVNFTPEDLKRFYWHSRRGMLELDLLLVPFAKHQLQNLSSEQLLGYKLLLEEEDQDLFVWLTKRQAAPTVQLQTTVDLVLSLHAVSHLE